MTGTTMTETIAPLKFKGPWLPSHKRKHEKLNQRGVYENGPDGDITWFNVHPDRTYRLRFAVPGEEFFWKFKELPRHGMIVVRKFPGYGRIRTPLTLEHMPVDFSEAEARKLWKLAASFIQPGSPMDTVLKALNKKYGSG